jgi:4-hydroxybenzoyl-CoA thioesterase
MKRFERPHRIRFAECDPAGIVFYPQYFVMFNGLVEDWIDALGIGFRRLLLERRIGLPTAHLSCDFSAVSRMGDDVRLELEVAALGNTSLTLALACRSVDGELRMKAKHVLVTTSLETHKPIAIPADFRAALEAS